MKASTQSINPVTLIATATASSTVQMVSPRGVQGKIPAALVAQRESPFGTEGMGGGIAYGPDGITTWSGNGYLPIPH
jgi:hypothetical protein